MICAVILTMHIPVFTAFTPMKFKPSDDNAAKAFRVADGLYFSQVSQYSTKGRGVKALLLT